MGNQHSTLPQFYVVAADDRATRDSLANNVNLANAKLGTRVIDVSNERLGRAERMLSPSEPASVRQIAFDKTTGYADVDGWETSRHNKDEKDWVMLQLGFPGSITGIEIDTAGFGSSSAPEIMVEACQIAANAEYSAETAAWVTILPQVAVSANASTMFALWEETEHAYSHVRLSIFPDGAVARFRVFGTVRPTWPEVVSSEDADQSSDVDLAFVGNNARVVAWSNEAHGRAENLIMPERGANAGDGWLTSRSRAKSDKSQSIHSDWVAIRLGAPGFLDRVVVDALHMGGTVPESCSIEACYSNAVNPMKDPLAVWHHVCARSNLSELDDSVDGSVREIPVVLKDRPFTHVRLTIYPDGGVKRFKVFGRRASQEELEASESIAVVSTSRSLFANGAKSEIPAVSIDFVESSESAPMVFGEKSEEVADTTVDEVTKSKDGDQSEPTAAATAEAPPASVPAAKPTRGKRQRAHDDDAVATVASEEANANAATSDNNASTAAPTKTTAPVKRQRRAARNAGAH